MGTVVHSNESFYLEYQYPLFRVSSFSMNNNIALVPDVTGGDVDDSADILKSLLSALGISQGLSQSRPSPQKFQFSCQDPMGEAPYKLNGEDGIMK